MFRCVGFSVSFYMDLYHWHNLHLCVCVRVWARACTCDLYACVHVWVMSIVYVFVCELSK